MKAANRIYTLLVGSLMILAVFSQAFALTITMTAPSMVVARSDGSSWSSTNWSGYAVTGATGSVTSASGSWTVPTVSPGTSGTTTYYSAFWVGIDGFSSSTVEQTGTMSETHGTTVTNFAWYEFYPNPMYQITSLPINKGDEISASVTYTGSSGRGFFGRQSSTFRVTIADITSGKSYTTTGTVSNAARSSAEWIAEAPSSYRGVLPLTNFGTVNYGVDNTGVTGTCYASLNGAASAPIGTFGTSVQSITMVTNSGATKASPLALSGDGSSFSIKWVSAGP
jgi:hypothetical protein